MARKRKADIEGLGGRLKRARECSGWRQIDVAMELEITEAAVCNQEADRFQPDVKQIIAYSEFYGVTIDYLLKGGEMKKAEDPFEGMDLRRRQLAMKIVELIKEF